MEWHKKKKIYMKMTVISWAFFSMTFLLMPLSVSSQKNQRMMLVLVGVLFWSSFIWCILCMILLKHVSKRANEELIGNKTRSRSRIGFFRNIPEAVADSLLIGALVVMAVLISTNRVTEYITYVDLSILCFSLGMHFLFEDESYIEK